MKQTALEWVFWIQIEKRDWFKNIWKSRGANALTIHFYGYHISIGMPWVKNVIEYHQQDNSMYQIESTNKANQEGNKTHGRFRFIKQQEQ
jgi:hypothetical protein